MEIAKIKIDGVTARVQYCCLVPAGLVGGTVTVEYSDPQWGGLTKTAVFKGNCVKDVVTNECVIRIPHETVAVPGENLQVGFYGTDSNGTLVIPTLWADLGVIQAAADPSDDVSTDPTLPVYTQLAQQIESLKDQIENIEPDGSGGNVAQGTGWTSEQIDILDSIGDHINFLDAEGGRLWDSLITALRSGQGTSAVLTGITAIYSGGSVEAGTQTRELKITVTATYDDGTSKTVTGYTLSPDTVSEGENTVTVTYSGKTSIFTVTGIVTPAEVTLESISAVFNGETAQAGTNASDLDITVTGHYSDGSIKTETGWTTAGIVSEGNNVFTIYLGDKTCTVSVVGVTATEDVGVGAGTKIASFEGLAADDGYGAATFNSSLIQNNKLYAFVLDPSTTVSAYARICLFGFVTRAMNGALYVMCPNHNFSGTNVSIAEADGVITLDGKSMSKFYAGTFYDLYEVGNDSQVITDGQLFDYVGTIGPTDNTGYENTLTIPASALTDDSYFAVVLRSWNTEIDMTKYASYGRTLQIAWGFINSAGSGGGIVKTAENYGSLDVTNKNDDGSFTITGSSGIRLYADANLVYDVYRANPTWG